MRKLGIFFLVFAKMYVGLLRLKFIFDMIIDTQVQSQMAQEIAAKYYPSLSETVKEGWAVYQQAQSTISQSLSQYKARNRSVGSTLSDILRALFKEKEINGIDVVEQKKLWLLVIEKKIVVRFNLMNSEGRTIHTDTEQADQYRNGQLEIVGFESLEYLYAGYILDDSKSDIINFLILKRNHDDSPIWKIDKYEGIYNEGTIPFTNPARVIELGEKESKKPRRASAKKEVSKHNNNEQPKTGTADA